jgi:hypothetical protein
MNAGQPAVSDSIEGWPILPKNRVDPGRATWLLGRFLSVGPRTECTILAALHRQTIDCKEIDGWQES